MTGKVVVKVQNLSKFYQLGSIGGTTLREDLERWWARARGKPDPWARVDETVHHRPDFRGFWALRDVSFDVREGEVLGVIGRNGAGKSTLLKVLSRITTPTAGRATILGRVGSLLEVGTGFHPELTGRENVYLNGAILGMSRAEIARKFDEIVEFAEMEKFIDTPVKRYSSGMTVRLAFSVAAHLEPEILIVDEVLAVGDIKFQQRCVSRMKAVAREGVTVLFVSHNLPMISSICTRAMQLDQGSIVKFGAASSVVDEYVSSLSEVSSLNKGSIHSGLIVKEIESAYRQCSDNDVLITIRLTLTSKSRMEKLYLDLAIENEAAVRMFQTVPKARGYEPISLNASDVVTFEVDIKSQRLAPGSFFAIFHIHDGADKVLFHAEGVPLFSVPQSEVEAEWASAHYTPVLSTNYTYAARDVRDSSSVRAEAR